MSSGETKQRLAEIFAAALASPPPPGAGRKGGLRALVTDSLDECLRLRDAGYNDRQIAEMFSKAGLKITAGTLKVYINKAKAERAGNGTKAKSARRRATLRETHRETARETMLVTTGSETVKHAETQEAIKPAAPSATVAATPQGEKPKQQEMASAAPAASAREKTTKALGHNPNAEA